MDIVVDADQRGQGEPVEDVREEAVEPLLKHVNEGLPILELGGRPTSFFEFWPTWFFYAPILVYWVILSIRYRSFGLPMVVNPHIDMGGMVGESKFDILQQAGELARQFILPYILRRSPEGGVLNNCDEAVMPHVDNDLAVAKAKGITFPFIVKPDMGCRGSGVQVVRCTEDLRNYVSNFPANRNYILQKLAPYSAEAGVFYERVPGDASGRVTSLTLKYRPVVVGDGKRTLKSLILRDERASILRNLYFEKNTARLDWVPVSGEEVALAFAGSHCRGSIFRNGNEYITLALSEKIDLVMRDFPDFHYGRLDIKFKCLSSFQNGSDFVIIEVNGVSSEKTHIWDSRVSLYEVFATLFEQYTTLFKMGRLISTRGVKVPSIGKLITTWWRDLKLSDTYPETD